MKPTRKEIEERIIGQILFDGKLALLEATNILDETEFYDPHCSILFGVCAALVGQNHSADVLSVFNFLNDNTAWIGSHLQRVSGYGDEKAAIQEIILKATDLSTMYAKRDFSNNLRSNCLFLKSEAQRQKVSEIIFSASSKLNDGNEVETVVEETTRELLSLSAKSLGLRSYTALDDAVDEAIKETEEELAGKIVRLSTGFPDLDRIIYGLERGRLYTIAAEEKVGKSLLSYQIGLSAARARHPSAIISLEMRATEIAKRFAGINNGQEALIRLNALKRFKGEIGDAPLFIRDGSASNSKVVTLAHKLFVEEKNELLIVDYLQLVELQGKDRVNEINDFVSRLKGLAMDLEIPVLLIAAVLNKQINTRSSRKPTPADIRDTGRLANDADCLLMLWKPDERDESYLELFVARSRYSKLGRVGLRLDSETLKLSETPLRDFEEVPLRQFQPRAV